MRAAVVGAGPPGFYAADKLPAGGFEVDLLDARVKLGRRRSRVGANHRCNRPSRR